MNQFLLAFLTGLTSGGISCVAIQGGLLLSSMPEKKSLKIKNILLFLDSKLIAYTLLGAILGFIGKSLIISPNLQGWLQIAIGIYMLLIAGYIANLHPLFRYVVIHPPKFVFKYLIRTSKDESVFAPLIIGILTILIPCGVTQAMMVYAVGSGNLLNGAGIMFAFILGTFPIFILFGLASTQIFRNKVLTIFSAFIIAFIGIVSINNGQILRGSVHTFQNYWIVISGSQNFGQLANINNNFQEVNITVNGFGYQSDVKTIKIGVPVKLRVVTKNEFGCGRSFVIPSLNYSKVLPTTGITEITFTPDRLGVLTYSCSMGMYTGNLNVIK